MCVPTFYSLGCTFYSSDRAGAVSRDQKNAPASAARYRPRCPRTAAMSPRVVRIVERMLAMDLAQRYQNAATSPATLRLSTLLDAGGESQVVAMRRRSRRRWALTALAGVLAVAALVAFASDRRRSIRQAAVQPATGAASDPALAGPEQPVPPAAGRPGEQRAAPRHRAAAGGQARLTAWLRENCQFGPEHAMVRTRLSDRVARRSTTAGASSQRRQRSAEVRHADSLDDLGR